MDNDLRFYASIEKYDPKEHMVYGYASTEALDSQGEIVKKDALASAIDDYMEYANIREMHQPSAVGKTKKAHLDSKGLYIAAKIVDKAAQEKCEEGVYTGFSIGGRVVKKIKNEITGLTLSEISLVDRPANPECKFDVWKAAGAKPEDETPSEPAKPETAEKESTDEGEKVDEKPAEKRDFSDKERQALADKDMAMPDGSYPIKTVTDLKNAISSWGRGGAKADVKDHIVTRAKALGATDELPADWPGSTKDKEKAKADKAENIKKCMSDVGRLAMLVEQLSSYKEQTAWEELMEGDSSDIPQRVDDAVQLLAGILKDRVNEETDELTENKGGNGTVTDQQGPMYMADKPKDLSKIDQYIAKGTMPTNEEIVELLKSMDIEPEQKAIDAFKWEFAGKVMTKIKQDQDTQMQKGDGKQVEKAVKKTTATSTPPEKTDMPTVETAAPGNTNITDALAALNTAVQAITSALAKPYANRPEYNNNNELTPDEKDKLNNGVAAGSERTSSGRMTENATVQTGKADTKLEIAKVEGTKDQAYVAKLEADLSALKGDVQKLLNTPNPVKPKATFVYYTLEKGHEQADSGDELAVKEKRSLELQEKLKSGSYTEADIKEASQLSINIMKLRRETANIKQT